MRQNTLHLGTLGVLIAALIGSLAADVSAQPEENPFANAVDERAGGRLFGRHCSRCHGISATGGETGPDLTSGVFQYANSDVGLFNVISQGIPNTEMRGLRRTQSGQSAWQLVAYLRSLAGGARVEVEGDPENGEGLFRGKGSCTSCHMVNGQGGRHGPDLSAIGDRRSPAELRSDLIEPDARVQPRWWTMRVTHRDGTRVEGLRMSEGTYSVGILDGDDNLWSFLKRDLSERERIETSSMPAYAGTMSNGELQDLVAYLYGLTRGDQ